MKRVMIFLLKCLSDKQFVQLKYFFKFKKFPNLKVPKTLNEKIQWLKLNDRTSLHTLCADKLKVRDYIKETIGEEYLIPLVLATKNVEDIKPEKLPDYPIVIKTNHDSGTYFLIKNKKIQNWQKIRRELKRALNRNFYYVGREWQYKNIEPMVIVEKMLLSIKGERVEDYKFECFNKKVKMINVDFNKEVKHYRNNYDKYWNLLPFLWPREFVNGKNINKPKRLEDMIDLAENIAQNFTFCRVDFYSFDDQIYFGEITFHPTSGFGVFLPKEKDLEFGELLKLPLNN